jgi:GNAT superfamily N-acetyltransferase
MSPTDGAVSAAELPANQAGLRAAEPGDCARILELIHELAAFELLAHEVVTTEDLVHTALFSGMPTAHAIVATLNHEIVGFALYFFNYSTFVGRPGLYLEDLYVQPAHRSSGLGRRMLVHLAGIAQARNCGRMEWAVLDWNVRARSFYEGLGARPMNDWTVHRLGGAAIAQLATSTPQR